jgi:predicted acyl esterase
MIDPARRVQSLYVPVSDGVRLAVDVWLPVERIARGERVGTAFRATRYHRADQPADPESEADGNQAAGELWTAAGFALVVADARGTGASFGSRTMELGRPEIADYGKVIDWVAAQPWSNGRVGVYGTSYEGQAAELVVALGNPHVVAVAVLTRRRSSSMRRRAPSWERRSAGPTSARRRASSFAAHSSWRRSAAPPLSPPVPRASFSPPARARAVSP